MYNFVTNTAVIDNKVVKRDNEWFVLSEDGEKVLGGPYDTKEKAVEKDVEKTTWGKEI